MVDKVSFPLLEVISDKISSRTMIDEDFVEKIIYFVVDLLGLDYYVRGVNFSNQPWNGTKDVGCEYSSNIKKLTISIRAVLEFYIYQSKFLKINRNELYEFLIDNIVAVVLHELEHADQMLKMYSGNYDIEARLLTASKGSRLVICDSNLFDYMVENGVTEQQIYEWTQKQQRTYLANWDYAPEERLAEHYSHLTMATIMKNIGSYPNISHYECLKLCKNYLRGYENGVPTHIYLETIGSGGSYPEIEAMGKDLDLVRRLSLGLRVSEEEHDCLKNTVSDLEALVLK